MEVVAGAHRLTSSTDASVFLHLRERRPKAERPSAPPLLLVHGATVASVLWDNPAPGWSLMDRLARAGLHVFALDLRGYGRSSRPPSFARPAHEGRPYARAEEVVQDVRDAVDFIRESTGARRIDLLGGSWGSVVCGKLAAEKGEAAGIRRLILYAPLYSEPDSRPYWIADPRREGRAMGAHRDVRVSALRERWDAEIPLANKAEWRPDGIFEALAESCLQDDAAYPWAAPSAFRAPAGTIADLNEIYAGRPLYDCAAVSQPTLLVRGSSDPVSTHADASRLFEKLGSAAKQYTVVGNGAHFMVGERRLPQLQSVLTSFLTDDL